MSSYVFIESRDPFESPDSRFVAQTAVALKQRGNTVTVFLVQNGVFAARKKAQNSQLRLLRNSGITVLADDFSLRERGIQKEELDPRIAQSNIDSLVDLLVHENTKAIWH
jgi:sulfur transfer complex TusBCD TusB component (DsrH family)